MTISKEKQNNWVETLFQNDIKRVVLDNGLTLVFREDNAADVASTQLWVKTGSIHEGDLLGSGVSHYVEHMLFKGTEKRSYQEISTEIHAAGGSVNAYTTFDRTVYYIDILSEKAELALDILSDIAFKSKFDEKEAKREREVILREIDMCQDDPDREISEGLLKRAFQKHPYRYPIIGLKHVYEKLDYKDLKAYYEDRYVPSNMVLVVVGALEWESVLGWAKQYFGHKGTVAKTPVFVEEPEQLAMREERLYGDYNLTRGALGFKVPALSHPDAPALDVLANVFGQGQSAILWQEIREEKGLVHEISASTWNPGTTGLFWISYTCDVDKREAVEKAIFEVIKHVVDEGVDPKMVEKCVRQSMVGELNSRKTMSGQASRFGFSEVVIGDLNYPQEYLRRLQQIVPGDLPQLIHQYLKPTALTLVSLEPESQRAQAKGYTQSSQQLPDFELHELSNGIRVLLQPWPHFPKVHMRACVLGGVCYEKPEERGLSSLMATMLARDTQSRSTLEIAQAIEGVGGSFGESVGNNSLMLGLEVIDEDLPLGLDILKEGLLHPAFRESTFETERKAQIAQIEENLDEIVDFGVHHLRKYYFGDHPFSNNPLGTIESLRYLQLDAVKEQWKRLICGKNLILTAAGRFYRDDLLSNLEDHFKSLPVGSFEKKPFSIDKPAKTGRFEEHMKREQAVVFQAYSDVGVTSTDYEVGELMDELCSGLSSQLFTKVREEKGMAYFIGSSRMIGVESGMFYFYGGTHPDQAEAVMKEIDKEIQRIQTGKLTDEEISRCKTRLKASRRMSLQTLGSRAMLATLDTLYGLPLNNWRTYDARIDRITKADLQAFAQKNFTPEKEVKLVVKAG